MYLFKPFENQKECDDSLSLLLKSFSSDREKLRISTFLGRFQTTNQLRKEARK